MWTKSRLFVVSFALASLGLGLAGPAFAEDKDKADGDKCLTPLAERLRDKERSERSEQSVKPAGEGKGFYDWFYGQRKFPNDTIPRDARRIALETTKGKKNATARLAPLGTFQATWTALGPSKISPAQTDTSSPNGPPLDNPYEGGNVSGRVSAIAVDPSDPNVVYVGGAQGGVWKTTDGGDTWVAKTDGEDSLAIGDIAIDPQDPDIVYAGTGEANGSCDSYYGAGLLKSTNGGNTWTTLVGDIDPSGGVFGVFPGQSISKVVIDPTNSNRLFVSTALAFISSGTSECDFGPVFYNGGVFRSLDGGNNWTVLNVPTGNPASRRAHDLVMDPTNPNVLYTAMRRAPAPFGEGGIWKTTDGGNTWAKLSGTSPLTRLPDWATSFPGISRITLGIGSGPAHNTLYASFENASTSGLWAMYKSVDAGVNWEHVDAGRHGFGKTNNEKLHRRSGPPFTNDMVGRRLIINNNLSFTVTRVINKNNLQYAAGAIKPAAGPIFWSIGAYPNYCDGQCFYDMTIGVDPTDVAGNSVIVGGNPHFFSGDISDAAGSPHSHWRSTDGGNHWAGVSHSDSTDSGLHVDDHDYAYGPDGSVWNGNDGGIWKSADGGTTWVNRNTNIAITQFQGLALDPSDADHILGGTQDNGTNIRGCCEVTPNEWYHADFGDGGQALIDPGDPDRMFHTYYNASFNFFGPARSDVGGSDGSGGWPFVGCYFGYGTQYYNGMDPTDDVSFYAPLAQHGAGPSVVYFGSDKVYRSPEPLPTVFGVPSWTAVSPVLTASGDGSGHVVSAIGVHPGTFSGRELLYVGTSDGCVRAGQVNATNGIWGSCIAGLPLRFVTEIEVDAADGSGNTAYVALSGFGSGHVFRITDGLGTPVVTDVSGDLPDIPATAIALAPEGIYVGTDIGVFFSSDGGTTYEHLDDGHPNVAVFGLDRHEDGSIVSATHGRGMFKLASGSISCQHGGDADSDDDITVADVFYLINYLFASGPSPSPLCNGDADANGVVDVADVFYLINYLFANGPKPG